MDSLEKQNPTTWWIAPGGVQSGPFSTDELRIKIDAHELPLDTFAFAPTKGDWRPLRQFDDFANVAMTNSSSWWLTKNGVQEGPYSESQIKEMLRDKRAAPENFAICAGQSGWLPLSSIPAFQTAAAVDEVENPGASPSLVLDDPVASPKNDVDTEDPAVWRIVSISSGEQLGPMSLTEVTKLRAEGRMKDGQTFVSDKEPPDFVPVESVSELAPDAVRTRLHADRRRRFLKGKTGSTPRDPSSPTSPTLPVVTREFPKSFSVDKGSVGPVFLTLAAANATGTLTVRHADGRDKDVVFRQGHPTDIRSSEARERLGPVLVALKLVDMDDVNDGIVLAKNQGMTLGNALIELGSLSREELAKALDRQAKVRMADLFTWTEGNATFVSDEAAATVDDRFALSSKDLVRTYLPKLGVQNIVAWLGGPKAEFVVVEHPPMVDDEDGSLRLQGFRFRPLDKRVMGAVVDAKTPTAVVKSLTGENAFEVLASFYVLVGGGFLRPA